MKSQDSPKAKNGTVGNVLRVGFASLVAFAICVWMVLPPLETLSYRKYDVESRLELAMPFVSLPDVGQRPIAVFSADGQFAAYLSAMAEDNEETVESQITVLDVETEKRVSGPFMVSNSSKPLDIVFSMDGKHLAAAGADEVLVWGLEDSQLRTTIALPNVRLQSQRYVAISHDGKLIATSAQEEDGDPAIWVFDAQTGNRLQKMERTAGTANDECYVFHPTANQLIGTADSESGDAHLCVWDVQTGKVVNEILTSEDCQTLAFAFSGNADRIAVALYHGAREYNPFSTTIFKLDAWEKEISIDNEDYIFWVAINPDGSQIALVDASATASIWSTGEGNRLQNFRLGDPSATAFWRADGALRLITNSQDKPNVAQLLTLRSSD